MGNRVCHPLDEVALYPLTVESYGPRDTTHFGLSTELVQHCHHIFEVLEHHPIVEGDS